MTASERLRAATIIRAVRNTPTFKPRSAATYSHIPISDTFAALRDMAGRGVCDTLAAETLLEVSFLAGRRHTAMLAATSRWASPATVRLAATMPATSDDRPPTLQKPQAWPSRAPIHRAAPRSTLAAAADTCTLLASTGRASPAAMLTRLTTHQDHSVRTHATAHRDAPGCALCAPAVHPDPVTRLTAAANPNTPACVLSTLATDPDADTRKNTAANPNTPQPVLTRLASTSGVTRSASLDDETRLRVAANPSCSAALLADFATDPSGIIRAHVARNPSTPPEILAHLAQNDPHRDIRGIAAAHPSLPSRLLDLLATDPHHTIREAVASHPSCPPELHQQLVADQAPSVHAAIAANTADPQLIAALAAHHDNPENGVGTQLEAARNPACPSQTASMLALSPNSLVRGAAADHVTDPQLLTTIAQDKRGGPPAAAAANPNCPEDTLAMFVSHNAPQVREAATRNPACPIRWLADLTRDSYRDVAAAAYTALADRIG